MVLALALMSVLFITDNAEFFTTVDKQKQEGYNWEYVGKNQPEGSPAITVTNEATGEESIYFKLEK